MSHHLVRFMKNICDDTGHAHHCIQGFVTIHLARDRDRAIEAAKHRFARKRKIKRWDMHADTFEVDEGPRVHKFFDSKSFI